MNMTASAETQALTETAARAAEPGRQWICMVCDMIYDEAAGMPEHGIAPGTPFEAIPEDWSCPECGVTKADFMLLPD